MQKIDVSSASPTLPAPAATGTPGYFTEGDAASGEQATVVSADWLNMVMMELVNIPLKAGIALSKADSTQVLAGIAALFGITGKIAAKGHLLFNINVLTAKVAVAINWGSDTLTGGSGGQRVTYDQELSAPAVLTLAINAAGGPPNDFHGTELGDTTGFNVWSASVAGTAAAAGASFRWISIGLA